MMRHRKLIALALAVCTVMALVIPAQAANGPPGRRQNAKNEGKQITVPINLTAEAVVFDVSVPTSLPMHLGLDGVVTTPYGLDIINNSSGPIKTTKLEITAANGWSFEPYQTNFSKLPTDSKKLALRLKNGNEDLLGTQTAQKLTFNPVVVVNGKNGKTNDNVVTLGIDAKVTPVSKAIINGEKVASIIFVLSWDRAM